MKEKKEKGKAELSAVSNLRPPAYNALTCKSIGKQIKQGTHKINGEPPA
jgi:hypothetical protein